MLDPLPGEHRLGWRLPEQRVQQPCWPR
jgi:hypothetical protein